MNINEFIETMKHADMNIKNLNNLEWYRKIHIKINIDI